MHLTDGSFCHLCGMFFNPKDSWGYIYTVKHFDMKDGNCQKDFKLQWHTDCYFEQVRVRGLH